MDRVVLVDDAGREIGVELKLRAHENGGRLHLAFSIVVVNRLGELLIQKRAASKYHFRGLWSNTCCSHPRPGELVATAARRRLQEEFGFDCPLTDLFTMTYCAHDPSSGLTEREFLHVLLGRFDGAPRPDRSEIQSWQWENPDTLQTEIGFHPDRFTPWLGIILSHWTKKIEPFL